MSTDLKYKCAHCHISLPLENLGKHLRNLHPSFNSAFSCGENGCFRLFGNLPALKIHLNREHSSSTHSFELNTDSTDFFQEEHVDSVTRDCSRLDNLIDIVREENFQTVSNSFIQEGQFHSIASINSQHDSSTSSLESIINDNTENMSNHNDNIIYDENMVLDKLIEFSLLFHNKSCLPRNVVEDIVKDSFKIFTECYNSVLQNNFDGIILSKLQKIETKIENTYRSVSSEKLLIKKLKEKGMYVKPFLTTIDSHLETGHFRGQPAIVEQKTTLASISIKDLYKNILEAPGTYESVENLLIDLKKPTSKISNFMQGNLWKLKLSRLPPEVNFKYLPFLLYFDDWEPNNALGSHKKTGSICSCYLRMPFLPLDYESKLENIFTLAAFNSSLKKLGLEVVLSHLINEMIDLENDGVNIIVGGKLNLVKPVLGLVVGDNLALHELLGFTLSFSANYCCITCKIRKDDLHTQGEEDVTLFRNEENYLRDLALQDVSQTGITKPCAFSRVPSFRVWENFTADFMHDMLEGTFHYDLAHIFHYLINIANYFSLEDLNRRKDNFDYGFVEIGNRSEKITNDNIKNKKFNMSASEMMSFVKYLPLMIADLIPVDEDVWDFFLCTLKILEIVAKYEVDQDDIVLLKNSVKQHHRFYVNFFNDTLKPKHHFLVHYASFINQVGPLRRVWCMNFEGKNRIHKLYSGSITSRKNLPLSLCRKEQLKLSYRSLKKESNIDSDILFGPKLKLNDTSQQLNDLRNNFNIHAVLRKWVVKNGNKYEKNAVLQIGFDSESGEPILCMVQCCLVLNFKIFFIVQSSLKEVNFNTHYRCYEVKKVNNEELHILNFENIRSLPTNLHYMRNGSYGVVLSPFIVNNI